MVRSAPRRPPESRESPRPTVLTKLALLGFGLVAALVVGEVLVRVFGIGPESSVVYRENYRLSSDPILQYELAPGSKDGRSRISSAGLRDHEYAQQKPQGVFRIVVVGDSITYGFGVSQRDAFSEQLEQLLNEHRSPKYTRFEVLNLGVTGYNIEQVLQMLRTRGLAFQPDLIVYAYCLNDLESTSLELESLKSALSPKQRWYRDVLLLGAGRLIDRSRFLLAIRYSWRSWFERPHEHKKPLDAQWSALADGSYSAYFAQQYTDPAGSERLRRGASALEAISRSSGAPIVTAIFPVFVNLAEYRLAPLHQRIATQFQSKGIHTYDLLSVYSTMLRLHGPVFILNALHPNVLGHRLAALYLLHVLTRDALLGNLDPRPAVDREFAELDQLLAPVIAASD